jgi:hypothetical protein
MRKMIVFALMTGAVLAFGCSGAGSSGSGSGSGSGGNGRAPAAGIGTAVRDGKFEFTVQKVQCGVPSVGSDAVGKKAQGQFCLVTVVVRNIGDKAQTFSDSSQKAFGADGVEYSADTAAGLYANQDAAAFLTEINPGNQVTGVLVYDIPAAATLARLELHDSPFSGGITVSLS